MVAAVVFATVIGTVSSSLVSTQLLTDRVDRKLAELREFLKQKMIDPSLRRKIRAYMEQLYHHKTGYDAREVLDYLPTGLCEKLLDSMYRKTVTQVPVFKGLGIDAIKEICLAMKQMKVLAGDSTLPHKHAVVGSLASLDS
eukprot:COSAG05_NODE_27_length_29281_cov_199.946919_5_plen_141_part_00